MAIIDTIGNGEIGSSVRTKINAVITKTNSVTDFGDAASRTVTDSATDTTVGRLLKVGDNGIQSQRAFLHQVLAVPASTNLNINSYPRNTTSLENGWVYTVQLTTSGTGVVTGAKYHVRQSAAGVFQLIVVSEFTGTNQPRLGITSGNILQVSQGGTSTQVVHLAIEAQYVGNTTTISPYYFGIDGIIGSKNNGVPAFSVAGVPTYDLYHQNNILGTVSQSGGVPTGANIQRGSNANGEYVRFADGTQICLLNRGVISLTANEDNVYTWTFPLSFSNEARLVIPTLGGASITNDFNILKMVATAAPSNSAEVRIKVSATQNHTIRLMAIGRWFS